MRDMEGLGAQMGLISSLRTGNVIFDMMICMLIPLLFRIISSQFGRGSPQLWETLRRYFFTSEEFAYKRIEHEYSKGTYHHPGNQGSEKDTKNNILQKAILLYIGEKKHLDSNDCEISYVPVTQTLDQNQVNRWRGDDGGGSGPNEGGKAAAQLRQYKVCSLPAKDVWVEITDGLWFMQSVQSLVVGNGGMDGGSSQIPSERHVFTLKATNPGGNALIDAFLDTSLNNYMERMRETDDNNRYLYMMVKPAAPAASDAGFQDYNDSRTFGRGGRNNRGSFGRPRMRSGDGSGQRYYKRYKLSESKTFNCVFFREKELLLGLLDNFSRKTGRYATEGFPHKLGLLLHGPPGTGKTSLIKALAHHTKRHVVNVPLSLISTNQELMDIVFDQKFSVAGEDMPLQHSFEEVIFVMEDVDAASPVVKSREIKPKKRSARASAGLDGGNWPPPMTPGDAPAPFGGDSRGPRRASVRMGRGRNGDSDDDDEEDWNDRDDAERIPDALDLAGLLNVLDGVVDCPNRILVMTTNHPEKLDKALIRPGRIDKILFLGYMEATEARKMIEHYFQQRITSEQYERLSGILAPPLPTPQSLAYNITASDMSARTSGSFTPAEIEQLCAEYDDVDTFLDALEERANLDKIAAATSAEEDDEENGMEVPTSSAIVHQVSNPGQNSLDDILTSSVSRKCSGVSNAGGGGFESRGSSGSGAADLRRSSSNAAGRSTSGSYYGPASIPLTRGLSTTVSRASSSSSSNV